MIYIDKPKKCSFGRSSHMISDNSSEELINFAKKIGLKIEWIQKRGKYDEHFDVMNSKYRQAIKAGAKLITLTEFGKILIDKKEKSNNENRRIHKNI